MKKVVVINVLIVLIILIFLELISNFFKMSGLMGIEGNLIYKKDNISYFYPNKSGIVFDKKIFTDKFGYRVPTENFEYNENNKIFILGDSVAFGNGVKEEETFIGMLRKTISSKNFLNSSVPGYQIKDQIQIINSSKNFKNVEKIFYFFTLNDIYGSSNVINTNTEQKKNEGNFKLKEINFINDLNVYLRNKSYLFMLIKGLSTDPSKRWFFNLFSEYQNLNSDVIKENFINLRNVSEEMNVEFLVIILPYEYQTRNCNNDILMPQKKISFILEEVNVKYKNFTRFFCNSDNPNKNFYKFDPMHLSKKGHKLIHKLLIDEINF